MSTTPSSLGTNTTLNECPALCEWLIAENDRLRREAARNRRAFENASFIVALVLVASVLFWAAR